MYVNVELVNTWKSRRRIQDICGQAHDRAISFLALLDLRTIYSVHNRISFKDITLIYFLTPPRQAFIRLLPQNYLFGRVDDANESDVPGFSILRGGYILDHSFHDMQKV